MAAERVVVGKSRSVTRSEPTALTSWRSARQTPALVSVSEAAEMLGVTRSTLYRSIARGDCPLALVRINGRLRIPRRAVERLLAGEPPDTGKETSDQPGGASAAPSATMPSSPASRRRPMCSAARRSSSAIPSV